jgi:hypothetical protein
VTALVFAVYLFVRWVVDLLLAVDRVKRLCAIDVASPDGAGLSEIAANGGCKRKLSVVGLASNGQLAGLRRARTE